VNSLGCLLRKQERASRIPQLALLAIMVRNSQSQPSCDVSLILFSGSEVVVNDVNFEAPGGKYCDYDSSSNSLYDCFSFTTPAVISSHSMGRQSAAF
jgi:hypothetical protein